MLSRTPSFALTGLLGVNESCALKGARGVEGELFHGIAPMGLIIVNMVRPHKLGLSAFAWVYL